MNIYFAHNGIDDGHPDEAGSPSIGMPPAPQFTNTSTKLLTNTHDQNNSYIITIIPIIGIALVFILLIAQIIKNYRQA